ncbi:MAG TPA: RcnB family protein [Steroidobacteraceae bacterium]
MKRAAVGILLASLLTGTAMAGQGYPTQDRQESPAAAHSDRHDENRNAHDRNHGRVVHPAPPVRYLPVRRVYHQPRGYYEHSWNRGERLPVAYYQRPYWIGDYRSHGLRVPPRGYHWVRVNHDAVLAVVTTGVVLDIVHNLFH